MPAATNKLGLSFATETTFGITPTATGTDMRFLSESLKQDTGTTASAEIQTDRQIPGVVRSTVGASGDTGFEYYLGSGALDTLLAGAALQQDGAAVAGSTITPGSGTVSVNATAGTYTASGTFGSGAATGEWIKITGFAQEGNNGYFRVSIGDSFCSLEGLHENILR